MIRVGDYEQIINYDWPNCYLNWEKQGSKIYKIIIL